MNPTVVGRPASVASVTPPALTTGRVAAAPLDEVLQWLRSSAQGLSSADASARLIHDGPNALRTHRVSAIAVLGSQLRNAVLILLATAAVLSFFLGDSTQAIIIGAILAASIALGFVNEYRAERASAALHSSVHHTVVVRRDEQLHAPSHWNIAFIRRFMLVFGPISSLFDFLTFGLMLGLLHAGPVEFRTGWFVESLATQTLIIFAIRTRRVPFFRSRPSVVLTLTTCAVVAVGIVLTVSPIAHKLGFTTLPWQFYTALVMMTVAYLVLVEVTKKLFYAAPMHTGARRQRIRGQEHRIQRRAARFSHADRIAHAEVAVPSAAARRAA